MEELNLQEQYVQDMEAKGLAIYVGMEFEEMQLTIESVDSVKCIKHSPEGIDALYYTNKDKDGIKLIVNLETIERLIYDYNRLVAAPRLEAATNELMDRIKKQHPAPDKKKFIDTMRANYDSGLT